MSCHFRHTTSFFYRLDVKYRTNCAHLCLETVVTASRILQILDHVGIYALIAGSYTPFLLIGMHKHNSAHVLCAGQWVAALFGTVFAIFSDLNASSSTIVELIAFLCMGFGVVLVWQQMIETLSTIAFRLLMGGGAAYTIGIIFFVMGEYRPIFHVVWHVFVVLGACLHWFDIYFYILPMEVPNSGQQWQWQQPQSVSPGSGGLFSNLPLPQPLKGWFK